MKNIPAYKEKFGHDNEQAIFEFLESTLKEKFLIWSYFVNWEKVLKNIGKLEIDLNKLNYLIGKTDFETAFRELVKSEPSVIATLPALAVRDGRNAKKFKILIDNANRRLVFEDFDFTKTSPTEADINSYLMFVKEAGIKELLETKTIKNLVDYVLGVEAGLDSNGRKNRSGKMMEGIVESFIKDICDRRGFRYLVQANAAKIKKEFGIDVPVDKSSRRYDFVINNGQQLFLIETNYYGSTGSKLKSTAGEYRNLHSILNDKFPLIWITDGPGWKTTARPLREAYGAMDYILNLTMVENQILETIVS